MSYGQFAYIYDRLMEDMPYSRWHRFLRQCWEPGGAPATVVDLGCGTGNISIPLAQSGLRVIGIDLSEDMLAVAHAKAESRQRLFASAQGGEVVWLRQDMQEWALPEQVDAVISCCDCINYLTEEEELAATFRQTFSGLKPGGTFIFDVHTQQQLRRYAEEQPFTLREADISYIWTCDLDEERCEIEHDLAIFVRESEWGSASANSADAMDASRYVRIDETHVQRAYPLERIGELLRESGFEDISVYADFTREAPDEETERAFFVCRK